MVPSNETPSNKSRELLKKSKHGLIAMIFSRAGLVALLLLLQIGGLLVVGLQFQDYLFSYYSLFALASFILVLHILSSDSDPNAKITWLVILMVAPAAGMLLYAYIRADLGHRTLRNRMRHIHKRSGQALPPSPAAEALEQAHPEDGGLARYLRKAGGFQPYDGTDVTYYPLGEDFFPALLHALEQAERYIFLEYFIIEDGAMWGAVETVLARKAKAGVDVRVLVDGTCEFTKLERGFPERLRQKGIQCRLFARIRPFVSTNYN